MGIGVGRVPDTDGSSKVRDNRNQRQCAPWTLRLPACCRAGLMLGLMWREGGARHPSYSLVPLGELFLLFPPPIPNNGSLFPVLHATHDSLSQSCLEDTQSRTARSPPTSRSSSSNSRSPETTMLTSQSSAVVFVEAIVSKTSTSGYAACRRRYAERHPAPLLLLTDHTITGGWGPLSGPCIPGESA